LLLSFKPPEKQGKERTDELIKAEVAMFLALKK